MTCSCTKKAMPAERAGYGSMIRYFGIGALSLGVWTAVYWNIEAFSYWIVYGLMRMEPGSLLGGALQFFFYDTPKILLLLVLMVYIISWLRAGLSAERIRDFLSGRAKGISYILAAALGAASPFCSCSTIPLFLGFISARTPIGITMAFLITSPIINEVAVVLLWGLLGWKFAVTYLAVGMLAGISGGIVMDALRAERWLQPMFQKEQLIFHSMQAMPHHGINFVERHFFAMTEVKGIFSKVWIWVVLGVAIGAGLHGFVPQNWFAEHLGAGQWWTVPLSVGVGIPLYTNATGIVPIMESFLAKGLPVGTTLAFCMSAVAVSLPEFMMLKQVMTWKLMLLLFVMLLAMFSLAGWFLNAAQTIIF